MSTGIYHHVMSLSRSEEWVTHINRGPCSAPAGRRETTSVIYKGAVKGRWISKYLL